MSSAKLKAVPQNTLAKAKARAMAKSATAPLVKSKQSFYVINDEERNRFVIVSTDDRLYKILGYSYNGTFDSEITPFGLIDMLNSYDKQYTSI